MTMEFDNHNVTKAQSPTEAQSPADTALRDPAADPGRGWPDSLQHPDQASVKEAASADDADIRAGELEAEIVQTRADMTETIEAIGNKLEPGNVVREAKETVRSATFGKVEQMAMGAQQTWDDVRRGDAGGIVETIRRNPIPAGMVAVGLGFLFMNRASVNGGSSRSWTDQRQAGPYTGYSGFGYGGDAYGRASEEQRWTDAARSTASRTASGVRETFGTVGDNVGEMADQAGETVGEFTGTLADRASQVPERAGEWAQLGTSRAQSLLVRTLSSSEWSPWPLGRPPQCSSRRRSRSDRPLAQPASA